MKTALIIPTLNAEKDNWQAVLTAISQQSLQPDYKLILDSCSVDKTVNIAESWGFESHRVAAGSFDHAGTRKWGINLINKRADIVIFMTQDALLNHTDSLKLLVEGFQQEQVAIAYGRQLPRDNASPIETFGRLFNYPATSATRSIADKTTLGMKVAFCSDSFAAYRLSTLAQYDAFPDKSIVGEDYITAARILLRGATVRYEAQATVKHSHDYSVIQEFKRYFDIGVFHQQYKSDIDPLGTSEKAGATFFTAELKYLYAHQKSHIPQSFIRTLSKYLGYKAGKQHQKLPRRMKRRLSMHRYYF
jgi:glycosyltransferase involved in cell wall biosynthesis